MTIQPREITRKIVRIGRIFCALTQPPPSKDDVFTGYDRIRQFYIIQQATEHFERRQDDPAPLLNKKILDVGCGLSAVGEFLVLSGGDVTALDTDSDVIDQAQEKAKQYGTDVTFLQGKIEDLIHSSEIYDVVICLDLFEYIDDLGKFLFVVRRLLKPEGMLIFSAISRKPLAWIMHIFLSSYIYGRTPRGSRKYTHFYKPDQLAEIFKEQGFKMAKTQGLAYDTKDKRWHLSEKISTRYLGYVR